MYLCSLTYIKRTVLPFTYVLTIKIFIILTINYINNNHTEIISAFIKFNLITKKKKKHFFQHCLKLITISVDISQQKTLRKLRVKKTVKYI